jgi:putative Ca2+/H+ antiporter (TMEM165/GDT1 family)
LRREGTLFTTANKEGTIDWKVFGTTFGAIFLAELGDKTHVANPCLAAQSKSLISVFCASIAAFSGVTLIAEQC